MLGRGDSLIDRLWNWGRVSRIDPCRPKGATINHLYQQMIPEGGEGTDDDLRPDAIVVPQEFAPEPRDLNEPDAEVMGAWIRQLLQGHRATLNMRYVLGWPMEKVGRDRHEAALCALEHLMAANRETVGRMRRLGA